MSVTNHFSLKISLLSFLISFPFLAFSLDNTSDALANNPIIESKVNLNLPNQVLNAPSSIDEIFNVLKTLEFQPVPGVSLMASDYLPENARQSKEKKENTAKSTKNNRTKTEKTKTEKNNTTTQTKKTSATQRNSNKDSIKGNDTDLLQKELERLKNENLELKQRMLAQPAVGQGIHQIANNLVNKFSQEREAEHKEAILSLQKELITVKDEKLAFENKIKSLNELPKEGDEQLIKKIDELTKTLELEKKTLLDKQNLLQKELNDKTNQLVKTQRELERLQIIQARNENVTNQLSNKLANAQDPLKSEIDKLTQENIVLKKALQEETLRSNSQIKILEEGNKVAQNKILALEQAQKNDNQNQTRLLLDLQNRAQQSELMRQKLEQQLSLTEQNNIQLQEKLEKLLAENLKNNQNYQLQLADLQQRLLNARRSEQEANRWARAAGVGNTNAANTRILNLQQQIDTLSASEENQRSIALFNQQQVNNLQSQLVALQAEIKSEKQSKAQLEKQIANFETEASNTAQQSKNTSVDTTDSKNSKETTTLNQQLNKSVDKLTKEDSNKKSGLSTEAGMQKL